MFESLGGVRLKVWRCYDERLGGVRLRLWEFIRVREVYNKGLGG